NTMVNTEGGTDDEEFRVAAVVDRVNTTMEVWTGTTFGCAQCHNHKFDPFSQTEYYQLFAFFNNTEDRGKDNAPQLELPTPEQTARAQVLRGEAARVQAFADAAALVLGNAGKQAARAIQADLKKQEGRVGVATTLVMKERPQPRPTHVMKRGNHKNLGDP